MENQDIILFSSDDWGWKTSKYQLSTRFAKHNRVLFVSSIGFRAPKASRSDIGRIMSKLKAFARGLDEKADNLFVLTPIIVPFSWFPLRDLINSWIFRWQLYSAKRKLGLVEPFLFVFSQNWYEYVKNLKRRKLVYYCVDEHSGFSGISQDEFELKDKKMAEMADLILCSAKTLYEKNVARNPATQYLPHGVDYENFRRALLDQTEIPEDLSGIPEPILLFFGHISYDWVDQSLLKYLARERPGWSLVLVGRFSMSADEFDGIPNIHLLGEREFTELPRYCKAAAVGIIPFVDSELTRNCNPLKLPEYLSAGLPVVSTDIPEIYRFGDKVSIANNEAEFLRAVEDAISLDTAEKALERSDAMKTETWEDRVNKIYHYLQES